MAGLYAARRRIIPTLPWRTFAPPLTLEAATQTFVNHYNNHRGYKHPGSVTPDDACFGLALAILK